MLRSFHDLVDDFLSFKGFTAVAIAMSFAAESAFPQLNFAADFTKRDCEVGSCLCSGLSS